MDPSGRGGRDPEVVYVETDVGRLARAGVRGAGLGLLVFLGLLVLGTITVGVCVLIGCWAVVRTGLYTWPTPTP